MIFFSVPSDSAGGIIAFKEECEGESETTEA